MSFIISKRPNNQKNVKFFTLGKQVSYEIYDLFREEKSSIWAVTSRISVTAHILV